eukprot:SAG11_NODE_13484_length_653_cov_1.285199_1_plen_44_part_01
MPLPSDSYFPWHGVLAPNNRSEPPSFVAVQCATPSAPAATDAFV